jgi:broad specificity phosphatase PhoE
MGVLLLARHGQASFGAEDYDVLSDLGERQSALLGERLRDLGIDRVIHGGMKRQRDTARIATEAGGLPTRSVEEVCWAEYDHEAMLSAAYPTPEDQARFAEGMAAAEHPRRYFQEEFERAVARWASGAHDEDYPEPFQGFRRRVTGGFEALLADLGRSETALVVTSGGVISVLCAQLLGLGGDRWSTLNRVMVNSSLTKVVAGGSGVNLLSVNDHAHLEHDRALITYR